MVTQTIFQLISHSLCTVVGLSEKVVNIYKHFGSDVKFLRLPFGTHGVPTDNYGSACYVFNIIDDGLNNCGIESIFEMFAHLYGKDYKKPASSSTPYTGTMYNFDQSPFTPSGNAATDFMNYYGGIYIPLACDNVEATCKLHVAFHGCLQTIYSNLLYDRWAQHAGYFQVADKNNVIVVFPRTANFEFQSTGKTNLACWDWFGGTTTSTIPFKQMPQIRSVANLLNTIIGKNVFD
ncbi:hypothetical protein HA402_004907 [Bradysia odoriphaga]|nr:hypothetical protein HA402_004907 [Bradysia odoriphaga]